MHALPLCPDHAPALEAIVDLKWLFIAEGVRVHVERMQADAAYASQVLARAEASPSPALRATALRLRAELGLTSAHRGDDRPSDPAFEPQHTPA
jgi:hypothetical protein